MDGCMHAWVVVVRGEERRGKGEREKWGKEMGLHADVGLAYGGTAARRKGA